MEVVKERREFLHEIVLQGIEGDGMSGEVLGLLEVAVKKQLWAYEALFLEGWIDHAFPVAQEVDKFLTARVFGLTVVICILEGNVRQRD